MSEIKMGDRAFKDKVLELIGEHCKYWQHRNEAMRGNFAILYSQVNDLEFASLPVGVPDGYALVPVEPTDEMRDAGNVYTLNRSTLFRSWHAMLAAAPTVKESLSVAGVPAMSAEAMSTLRGMVEYCLNARVCMGMDEGFASFDPEIEHDFVKELRAFADDAPTVKAEQVQCLPQEWWQIIHDTLRNYRLTTIVDQDGDGYPLIDAMTADGQPVSDGINECDYLTDAIWNALPTQAPSLPAAGSAVESWRDQILRENPKSEPGYWPDALIVAAMGREIEQLRAALSAQQSAQGVSVPVLNKTREQWQKLDAKLVATGSSTAIFHAIRDAQHDIECLHRALLASHGRGEA
ncbi:hypothetical protein H3221_013595 [Pseudomonas sp. LMG 31766]|uniref:Uncharacterized protein n=1 Tax=Pseudomonas chaetocerotis TaxID=2758695 RepID=A0A931D5G2_9PSED|nr:hypothetical protein [Pseudomonas chaetocerotis]MBZ9665786.1 hypothetical protein [Pseudomonas chaetocerotis]